ncbi:MAG: NAD-dependent epimerase/dehydratase family protein [Candidatus Nanohaloarchaea archaeon]
MILIAGGAGYLGSRLAKKLLEDGHEVRIMDNMSRERYITLWSLDEHEFYEGDVRDEDDIKTALEDVDTVFCLADVTNAGKSFEREELTREVNYHGVTQLFEMAGEAGVDKFIYTSSASLYGNTPGKEDESFDCDPVSPYGKEKLKAEKHILANSGEYSMDSTALRLGTVYGYSIGMRFDTVINYFTYLASQGKPLTVHESALDEYRPYVHVDDVVRAYQFAYDNTEDMDGDTFNIVGQNMLMDDVLESIKNVFPGVEIEIVENPTDNKVSYRTDGSAIEEKGFETRYSMEHGIKTIKKKFENVRSIDR